MLWRTGPAPTPPDVLGRARGVAGLHGARAPGGSAVGPAGPGPAPAPGPGMVLLPPNMVAPAGATDFVADARAGGLTSANTPAVLAPPLAGLVGDSTTDVPTGRVGVIRSLDLATQQITATTDVVWRLLFDGSPVQGWAPLTIFPQNAPGLVKSYGPDETYITVPEGSRVTVQVEVRDAGTYVLGVSYHGWSMDINAWTRYLELWGP